MWNLCLVDHRLGSSAGQESKTAVPAVSQRVRRRQQLRQRVHSTSADSVASLQTFQPLGRAAGSLRRLRLLRFARMTDEIKKKKKQTRVGNELPPAKHW